MPAAKSTRGDDSDESSDAFFFAGAAHADAVPLQTPHASATSPEFGSPSQPRQNADLPPQREQSSRNESSPKHTPHWSRFTLPPWQMPHVSTTVGVSGCGQYEQRSCSTKHPHVRLKMLFAEVVVHAPQLSTILAPPHPPAQSKRATAPPEMTVLLLQSLSQKLELVRNAALRGELHAPHASV
eukprot:Amastigsp_a342151_11.p3 type:complete len:183 gc:universal Amastigsp_a342151_11:1879-1331(-)